MTVAELIAKLETCRADALVVTPGFDESGYENIAVGEVRLMALAEPASYTGIYINAPTSPADGSVKGEAFDAVEINFD